MELNLRIDEDGRTTYDPANINIDSNKNKNKNKNKNNNDGTTTNPNQDLDFTSKAVLTNLASPSLTDSNNTKYDDLLFDCEITDCGLLPRTFWVPCKAEPRCTLEKMALEVFHHHVPENHVYDPSCSGAEWWVQIRPSPAKTGRYSLIHAMDKQKEEHNKDSEDKNTSCDDDADDDDDDDDPPTGISFHWDKDEELRLMTGGSMYIHPHISTVTYLTDLGAPTMVLDCQVASMTGSEGLPNPETHVPRAFISWPKTGKHLSFDGKHLHAAPIDLMPPGSFETQIQLSENDNDSSNNENNKKEVRRKRRVTFLVNIWLNYRPFGVNPFPHTMIDKLSKIDTKEGELFTKHSSSNEKPSSTTTVIDSSDVSQKTETFAWPLGGNDSKDNIQVKIPLLVTQQQMPKGGNVCLQFKDDFNNLDKKQWGVSFLKKEKQDTSEEDKECQSKTKQKSEQDHQNPDETKSKKQKTSSN